MSNVGAVDRLIRLVAGAALIVSAFLVPPVQATLGAAWLAPALVGLVLVGTAAIRFCPAYRVLGINTCGLR